MTIDHFGKIVAPDLFTPTHAVGRVAFPLLAWIVAVRLTLSPELAPRYLRTLLPWALVSQPVYVVAGREWWQGNILVTLALGVLATLAVRRIAEGRRGEGVPLLALSLLPAAWVEFGVPGVVLVPALAALASHGVGPALWALGPLGVLVNLDLADPVPSATDLCALAAAPLAWLSLRATRRWGGLPRLPKHVFYAYYPAHLALLHWIDVRGWLG
jgi:hypothetical protein